MSQYQLSDPEIKEIWQQMLSELKSEVTETVFNIWVINNPLSEINLEGDSQAICTFLSPTAFHSQNIQKNLADKYTQKLDQLLGRKSELKFKIGTPKANSDSIPSHISQTINQFQPGTPQTATQNKKKSFAETKNKFLNSQPPSKTAFSPNSTHNSRQSHQTANNQQTAPQSPRVEELFSAANMQSATMDRVKVTARNVGLRDDLTFETFAVSGTNELAHAAATAVSQRPGTAYNPLFIYGGVGVGKTHLMHAIGNNILHNEPNTKIIYCTGEEFTNQIIDAIKTKKAIGFKHKYRQAQVLLIDDVQFIAGKNTVQEEFFHTFNALTQQHSQVVLTSDKPPHEINLLEDRLRSRFEAGLMIDIGQPTFELRTAILLIKAQSNNLNIPIELAQTIASKVDSARKIEGVIKQIQSAIDLQNETLNEELIDKILKNEATTSHKKIRVKPQDVIKAVANHYHVKQTAIRGKGRVKHLVTARHVAMYLLCNELGLPLKETGRWFSNRDHTSVLHARDKVEKLSQTDPELQQDISALKMSLQAISR